MHLCPTAYPPIVYHSTTLLSSVVELNEVLNVERIIRPETYKFIESQLHNYAEIERQVKEWRLSVKYPETKQATPNTGYISDPTANQAIKLAEPPKHIRDLIKWLELIDKTRLFCHQRGNRIFDIWYGKERQSATRAYTRGGIRKKTFEKNRDNAVYFLFARALNAGLCKLKQGEIN